IIIFVSVFYYGVVWFLLLDIVIENISLSSYFLHGDEDDDTIGKDANMGSNPNERNKQMDTNTNTDSEGFVAV
ncbi:hypothetical protein Tco_1013393, partial [Tanacetum coccineum]